MHLKRSSARGGEGEELKEEAGSGRRRLEVVLTRRYSLVLIAPLHERTADGFDYRVLLLQRHAKSSTFSTAHVFPGPSPPSPSPLHR